MQFDWTFIRTDFLHRLPSNILLGRRVSLRFVFVFYIVFLTKAWSEAHQWQEWACLWFWTQLANHQPSWCSGSRSCTTATTAISCSSSSCTSAPTNTTVTAVTTATSSYDNTDQPSTTLIPLGSYASAATDCRAIASTSPILLLTSQVFGGSMKKKLFPQTNFNALSGNMKLSEG